MTTTSVLIDAAATAVAAMPDPAAGRQVHALEEGLASWFDVPHAVAVSSGTAALHCGLVAAGVGPGDEVLVPATSVPMSVAPITYTGARPTFVDAAPDGSLDLTDAQSKITQRTRAMLAVHLWGRTGRLLKLADFAATHQLTLIEDACQAFGTRDHGRPAGTVGAIGAFSLKDGKIIWSGEGGFVITADGGLAARCRAARTHWQLPSPGERPGDRIGFNYRLAEPLAAIARANLDRADQLLRRRRHQTQMLLELLRDVPGLHRLAPADAEEWNHHAPQFRLDLPRPRELCARLAAAGVPNSVGTHNLTATNTRRAFAAFHPAACPMAERHINSMLAVIVTDIDDDDRIRRYADTIVRESRQWTRR